jgi:type I restriction enzyme, S subunit
MPTIVDSDYLNLFLNSRLARRFGSFVKTDGVNQSNINGDKLSNYPFPYCSIAEQREVVRILEQRLSVVDQMEEDVSRELLKAEVLRKSILVKAFSGGLVSQNPQDETASMMLKRTTDATRERGKLAKKETKRKAA